MTYVSDAFTIRVPETKTRKRERAYFDNFIKNALTELNGLKSTICFNEEQVKEIVKAMNGNVKVTKDDDIYIIKLDERR